MRRFGYRLSQKVKDQCTSVWAVLYEHQINRLLTVNDQWCTIKNTKIKLSNFFSQGGKTFFYKYLYKNTENEDSIKPTMENIVDKN